MNINFLDLHGVRFYWLLDGVAKEALVHIYERCSVMGMHERQLVRSGNLNRARRMGSVCKVCAERFGAARYEGALLDAARHGKRLEYR